MEVWARTLGGFSFYECDTREILTSLGYTPEEIQNLLDKGVALEPQA
jgi:hypothetical protein